MKSLEKRLRALEHIKTAESKKHHILFCLPGETQEQAIIRLGLETKPSIVFVPANMEAEA
ncbi:MAG: hypothetical protein AB2651_22085 [Candidatus Thiodiazotropha sp.]